MESRFLVFRFFIVPAEQHLFTQPVAAAQKLAWFGHDFLKNREHRTKTGVEYALFINQRDGDFVRGKLCRKRIFELHEKGEEDVNLRRVEDWPYLEFLVDLREKQQLMLIQESTAVTRDIVSLESVLSAMANEAMFNHGYATSFEPLVHPDSFWSAIRQADGIFRLQFTLKSPNFFGAESSANEGLRQLRDEFNNTEMQIVLRNEKGNLKVPEARIDTYRDYADKGGGSWSITVKKGTRKRRIKSEQNAVRITVELPDDEGVFQALKQALQTFIDAA